MASDKFDSAVASAKSTCTRLYPDRIFHPAYFVMWQFAAEWLKLLYPHESGGRIDHKLEYLKMDFHTDCIQFGSNGYYKDSIADYAISFEQNKKEFMADAQNFYLESWPTLLGVPLNERYFVFRESELNRGYLEQLQRWAADQKHLKHYNPITGIATIQLEKM
jgi:hypothetical protein